MSNKQLTALFACALIPWTIGNGMLPLLPVYATRIGASQTVVGLFMAVSYAALAVGTLAAGWLSDRYQRRKQMIILSGLVCIPFLLLLGTAQNIWILALYSSAVFFLGGAAIALTGILAGLFAGEEERGRVFGVLLLAAPVGAVIGGVSTGLIVDSWGYPAMFAALALFCILWPLMGFFLADKVVTSGAGGEGSSELAGFPRGYYFLMSASLVSAVALFVMLLVRSLEMDTQGFSAAAVSGAAAVGSIASIPLLPIIGRLSDRRGRVPYLALGYAVGIIGVLVLGSALELWQFWMASVFLTFMVSMNTGLGAALVTDLLPSRVLGRGMSLFNSTIWIGGILGFASAGYVIQNFGTSVSLFAAGILLVVSLGLCIPIRKDTN